MESSDIYYRFIQTKNNHPKGIVLITHGFRGYGSAHKNLVRALISGGYHVIIWDLPAHGRSNGTPGYIADFKICIDAMLFVLTKTLQKERKLPVFLLAHSIGFSVVALTLAHLKEKQRDRMLSRIHGVLGVNPAFHILHNVNPLIRIAVPVAPLLLFFNFFRKIRVANWSPEQITHDKHVERFMKKNRFFYRGPLAMQPAYEMYRAGEEAWKVLHIIQCRVHLIFGQNDTITYPIREKDVEKAGHDDISVKVYEGLKHDPLDGKHAQHVWNDILLWMNKAA